MLKIRFYKKTTKNFSIQFRRHYVQYCTVHIRNNNFDCQPSSSRSAILEQWMSSKLEITRS